jgi:hypothetical protein
MFGQPHWFRLRSLGIGLAPRTWQGWLYSAAWLGTILLPSLLLLDRRQPLEAVAWVVATMGALTYDAWKIVRALRHAAPGSSSIIPTPAADKGVLYILDSCPGRSAAMPDLPRPVRGSSCHK